VQQFDPWWHSLRRCPLPGGALAHGVRFSGTRHRPQEQAVKIPPGQLDSLVAPIALYPDPLLARPCAPHILEIIQLQRWLE
jgi:hypothetical protein